MEELSALTESVGKEISCWKDIVGSATDRQALLIVNAVGVVRSLGGSIAIPSYCTLLFSQTGFTTLTPNTLTVIMSFTSLTAAVLSTAASDIAGRRPLLIVSCVGCCINLTAIAVYFCAKNTFMLDVRDFVLRLLYCMGYSSRSAWTLCQ